MAIVNKVIGAPLNASNSATHRTANNAQLLNTANGNNHNKTIISTEESIVPGRIDENFVANAKSSILEDSNNIRERQALSNAILHNNHQSAHKSHNRIPFSNTVHQHGIQHSKNHIHIATADNITMNKHNHSHENTSNNNNNNINTNNNTTTVSPFFSSTLNYESTSLHPNNNSKSIKICKDGETVDSKDKENTITIPEDKAMPPNTSIQIDEISMNERTEEQILDEERRMSFKKRQADDDDDDDEGNGEGNGEGNILTNDEIQCDTTQEFKKQKQDQNQDQYHHQNQHQNQHQIQHQKSEIVQNWDDLDSGDFDDPLMVSEYVEEIFQYLYETETKTLPDPNYLQLQRNLRPKMRSILVDWLIEVHLKFKLLPETLFLAINIMDRFLSKELVQVDRLQLLATGSLFIAAKYEEVYSPTCSNYAYITDGAFTEDEILNAEKFILEILNFNMSYPNPMNFLRRISKADNYNIHSRTIAKYLLEITIIDHKFIGYLPSLCAASAMFLSRKMIGKNDWNNNLIHYSGGYNVKDFKNLVLMLIDYLVSPIIHEEFFKKYAQRKFMKVSMLARQWAKKVTKEGRDVINEEL